MFLAILMVRYSAPVLLYHPHAVLLGSINGVYAVAVTEHFHVESGERLVGTVVFRTDKTVELAVVQVDKTFLKFWRLGFKPFLKAVANLVNLGVGKLDRLGIRHLYVVAVVICANALVYIRHGVVQGMFQKAHAVVSTVLTLYTELLRYLHVAPAVRDRILVK